MKSLNATRGKEAKHFLTRKESVDFIRTNIILCPMRKGMHYHLLRNFHEGNAFGTLRLSQLSFLFFRDEKIFWQQSVNQLEKSGFQKLLDIARHYPRISELRALSQSTPDGAHAFLRGYLDAPGEFLAGIGYKEMYYATVSLADGNGHPQVVDVCAYVNIRRFKRDVEYMKENFVGKLLHLRGKWRKITREEKQSIRNRSGPLSTRNIFEFFPEQVRFLLATAYIS